ncbi:MAG: hypothetical protein JW993_05815 [Sedimentisphaerales bacterium]|nr:hypothetical protein [Sedimentisphaerales bacterium]
MQTIVESNRSLLRLYERAARIVGLVLLCGGVVWLLIFMFWVLAAVDAAGELPWPGTGRNLAHAGSAFFASFLVPGFLALLIGQFIRYSLAVEGRPGWILRHGVWVLYACAVVLIGQAVLRTAGWESATNDPDRAGLLFVSPSLVPLLAKILICVGLAQLLGRVLPIIDESRTLV